jgi:hypothetical protein
MTRPVNLLGESFAGFISCHMLATEAKRLA